MKASESFDVARDERIQEEFLVSIPFMLSLRSIPILLGVNFR
jgi:hypothetical protein